MLFHLGSLWRLNELGYLPKLARISSVSGGSITAGVLGYKWSRLGFDAHGVSGNFLVEVVAPIRNLADKTLDVGAVLGGVFLPGTIGEKVAAAYRKHLFGDATLQDLPDTPRFVINATNLQSGALWRFMKPYMRDYRVGEFKNPRVPLATAVAASSAFPPVLSPIQIKVNPQQFTPGSGLDLQRLPYTERVVLSDGGVYDNLGLETAWKRYDTILVSDAGKKMEPEEKPAHDWARQSVRVLSVIDNQVRSLRKRQLIDAYATGSRKGTYWGIGTNIDDYHLPTRLPAPHVQTLKLAGIDTRLAHLDGPIQEKLINWGYAVCDAAMRRHVEPSAAAAATFPYPNSGV